MDAAGLAAAVSYADATASRGGAARLAVLERAPGAGRGGVTRYTSSWFCITADRRLDPSFVGLMDSLSGGLADLDYCRTLEQEVPAALDFLDDHGVEVAYFEQPFPNRNTGGGLGMPVGGGIAIVDGLAGILERLEGAKLRHKTEAVRLTVSPEGRVDEVADTAGQFDVFHGEPVDPRASKPDPVFYPYVYYHEYPAGTFVLCGLTFGRLADAHAAGEAG